MFYKKQKIGKKWYLRSFTAGTYDTKDVAERLSEMSTVSKGDTYAVLIGLGEVLGSMMELGYSVKQDGLGTFYLVGNANGQGVDTPEEVSPEQFRKVTVTFIPEQSGTEQPGAETNHRPLAGGMDGTGGDGEKVKGITSMDFTGKVAEFCKFQK